MSSTDDSDRIFKALADGRRRAMLDLLKDHPRTTGEIATAFPALHRTTVMQHLGVLEAADLIIVERKGRERINHLNPLPIHDIHTRWIGEYAALSVQNLSVFKAELEGRPPR